MRNDNNPFGEGCDTALSVDLLQPILFLNMTVTVIFDFLFLPRST